MIRALTKHLVARGMRAAIVATAAGLSIGTTANAQTFNTAFGGTGYTCSNQTSQGSCSLTSSSRPFSSIWNTGDFWSQSVSGSGITSLTSLSLNLNLHNVLATPVNVMQFSVSVNGTNVGSTGTYNSTNPIDFFAPFTFNFAAINAAIFNVKVQLASPTVPSGQGSMALYTDGQSTIQLQGASSVVPEPSTYLLMTAGLFAVGVASRRRKAQR